MPFFQQEKKKLFYGIIVKILLSGVFAVLLFVVVIQKAQLEMVIYGDFEILLQKA